MREQVLVEGKASFKCVLFELISGLSLDIGVLELVGGQLAILLFLVNALFRKLLISWLEEIISIKVSYLRFSVFCIRQKALLHGL